jgi:hypothetical protein
MKRLVISCALALPLFALATAPLQADVKSREKTHAKLEGMLGRMVGIFGGKGAREGIVSSTAVKGSRKATMTDSTGQIVDLSEEKVYDLDLKKQTYTVTTFEEIRNQMREAREKAEREAEKEGGAQEPSEPGKPAKEFEVDFDVKETGQKKALAGYDTREVVMTITVREKGKALEEGGGLVMTTNSWMGPRIPALKEEADFDMRYWKQLQGPEADALSPEQMAQVLAMFPLVQKAMDRMKQEGTKLDGTPLAQTTVFESVKSKAQMTENQGGGGGGLGGMLARRLKKDSGSPRATFLTIQSEFQEIGTSVAPEDVAIPAGFKERKK